MKRPVDYLSSMQFTTGILVVLMFWFAWGVLLAESDRFQEGFRVMNRFLAPEWFSHPGRLSFVLKLWFVGLCIVMAVLGVNLIFCSWTKILRLMRNKQAASRLVMLIIHMVFGLVALAHFGSFVLGYRYENVHLREGQTFRLPEGYALTVTAIHVEDNPVLFQPPKGRGPGAIDPETNFCEVVLTRDGKETDRGPAFFLRPFVHEDIQVTLKGFVCPRGEQHPNPGSVGPGVRLIISRNPAKMAVFILFPVMIAGIGIYLVMTWRTRPTDT
jgi:hypothetical protein